VLTHVSNHLKCRNVGAVCTAATVDPDYRSLLVPLSYWSPMSRMCLLYIYILTSLLSISQIVTFQYRSGGFPLVNTVVPVRSVPILIYTLCPSTAPNSSYLSALIGHRYHVVDKYHITYSSASLFGSIYVHCSWVSVWPIVMGCPQALFCTSIYAPRCGFCCAHAAPVSLFVCSDAVSAS
jgi:hypothetical protein